jgi:fatty acid desaturase
MACAAEADGAYAALRRMVAGAGLLRRAYGYYLARGAVSFAILACGIGLAFVIPQSAALLPLAATIIAIGSVQVALVGHDAGHLAVFESRTANAALGSLCWSLSLSISFWYWSDRHTRHHVSTNDSLADPDLQWASLVAYSEEMASVQPQASKFLRRHQAVLGPLYALLLPFAFRIEGWQFTVRHLRGARRRIEILLMLSGSLAWLLPILGLGWWWVGVLIASQVLAGLYLSLAIAPNHIGMPTWPTGTPLTFLERQVLSSRNVAPNPVWDFVFGGLNYQIEHHLFPTMPRCNLAQARALVKPFCAKRGLAYTEMGALASYGLVLRELRRVGRAAAA